MFNTQRVHLLLGIVLPPAILPSGVSVLSHKVGSVPFARLGQPNDVQFRRCRSSSVPLSIYDC